jgi:hypothetical protein
MSGYPSTCRLGWRLGWRLGCRLFADWPFKSQTAKALASLHRVRCRPARPYWFGLGPRRERHPG